MISLEGLTLTTGRHHEAGWIMRTFAHYIRDGLIPNLFPEGESEGLYHTADATLWFFHALDRYLDASGMTGKPCALLLPDARGNHRGPPSARHAFRHRRRSSPTVCSGPGRRRIPAFTWMDAKVDGWVVTPRRGKAVEINALWHNALQLLAGWLREENDAAAAQTFSDHAEKARQSFNRRFWNEERGYLFDVVDGEHGDDPACRPNQVLAISLPHIPCAGRKAAGGPSWKKCATELLTPVRACAP